MATTQSGPGGIEIFEDFLGAEWTVAETADDSMQFGALRVIGQGKETTCSGIVVNESDPCLSGVCRFTITNENVHSMGLTTALMFDVTKMAPIVLECRVQFSDLDTKAFFFGLSSVNGDTAILQDHIVSIDSGAATTITNTATSLAGFLFSSEATDDDDWFMVHNGGTTAGETSAGDVDANDDAVAGEWQILRLEVDPNGDCRWWIDGVLKQTIEAAISTSTDVAAIALLENQDNTTDTELCDIDYILVRAARDWTV